VVLILLSGCSGRQPPRVAAAPAPAAAAPASVRIGPDWLEVQFPPIDLPNVGCQFVSEDKTTRLYLWFMSLSYSDWASWDGHVASIKVSFTLASSVSPSASQLDSALATVPITIDEVLGHRSFPLQRTIPTRAWARWERGSLRLRVEGEAALREIRRPAAKQVGLTWCQRDRPFRSLSLPPLPG
jgi:hypothetical protein